MNSDFKKITDSLASLLEHKNRNYVGAHESLSIFSNKSLYDNILDNILSKISKSDELKIEYITELLTETLNIFQEKGWYTFDEFKD